MTTSSLRWGRIVLGGLLAEGLLVLAVIPVQLTGGNQRVLTVVAVAGSFVALALVARWLCRPLARPVVHGLLMGVVAAGLYLALQVAAMAFATEPPQVPPIYYVAHVLKLAGGALGGWWAARGSAVRAEA
jgi:hypothetical protein